MSARLRAGGLAAAFLGMFLPLVPASRADDGLHNQMVAARTLFRGTVGHRSAETLVLAELANSLKPGKDAKAAAKERREKLQKLATLRIEDDLLQADEDELVQVRHDLRDARNAVTSAGVSAFADAGTNPTELAFLGWFRSRMSDRTEELETRAESLRKAIDERRERNAKLRRELGLPDRAPGMPDSVMQTALQRGSVTSWRDISVKSAPATTVAAKDKSVIVSLREKDDQGLSANPFQPDIGWMRGRISFLGSGTASGEGGQEKRFSVGATRRIGARAAVGLDLQARIGNYALAHLGSKSAYRGVGATAGLRIRLAKDVNADVVAYGMSTWTGISGSAGSGEYRADTAGLYARLAGRIAKGRTTLTPSASARYKWTSIGGYTDSAGTAVPSQAAGSGEVNLALRLARDYDAATRLQTRISPYVEVSLGRVLDTYNRSSLASETSLEKGHATAKAKVGAETSVAGGASVKVSGYVLRRLDNDYRELGTRARLTFRF